MPARGRSMSFLNVGLAMGQNSTSVNLMEKYQTVTGSVWCWLLSLGGGALV